MTIIPDWAPNVHPLIIHFPVAILILAVAVDFGAVVFRRIPWLVQAATLTYVAGAVSVLAAFLTGRQASETVNLPPLANPVLNIHADLAQWTLIFFGVVALGRLGLLVRRRSPGSVLGWFLFLLGLGGLGLVVKTAENGAQLVYRFGVGVQKNDEPIRHVESETGVVLEDGGSWRWLPGETAGTMLSGFDWLEGRPSDLTMKALDDGVALLIDGDPVFVVAGGPLGGVQVDVRLNLDDFRGDFSVVHHVKDTGTYDYVSVGHGTMLLGRSENHLTRVLHEKEIDVSGWAEIRAVGQGRHARGYLNGVLLTHGHLPGLPPGRVGFYARGEGTVLLRGIRVQDLE